MSKLAAPFALIVAAACGSSSQHAADAPAATTDVATDGTTADATCASYQTMCSGTCVDLMSDPMHCGSCPNACTGAMSACAAGTCVVPYATTWAVHYGGPSFGNNVEGITTDSAGNVYLTGMFSDPIDLGGGTLTSAGSADILVASFSPAGAYRWARRFGGTMDDQGTGITVDAHGTVFVTGTFTGGVDFGGGALANAGSGDVFVLELAATDGSFVAAHGFGTTGDDAGLGIVVDANGNYTVGGFIGAGTLDFGGGHMISGAGGDNAFVASFDSTGTHRWSRLLAGAASTYDSCQAIAIDSAGNVTTAGDFEGSADFGTGTLTSAGDMDAFVASYTPAGVPRWAHRYGGTAMDSADGITVDANGGVMFVGIFHNTVDFGSGGLTQTGVVDGYAAALDASGNTRWARHVGATTSGGLRSAGVAGNGDFVAGGSVEGDCDLGTGALAPLGLYDVLVAGFAASDGSTRFARRLGGSDYDEVYSLAVAHGGAVAVGGTFRGTVDLGTGTITGGSNDNGFALSLAP